MKMVNETKLYKSSGWGGTRSLMVFNDKFLTADTSELIYHILVFLKLDLKFKLI